MPKRSLQYLTFVPTSVADGTTYASGAAMVIDVTTAAGYCEVQEIYIGGQASSSTINGMQFARNTTVTTTASLSAGASDGPLKTYGNSTATPVVVATQGSTLPARTTANNSARLNLSLNVFGGISRWQAAPGEEWGIQGTLTNVSGSGLSSQGFAAGTCGAHIIYEVFILALTFGLAATAACIDVLPLGGTL